MSDDDLVLGSEGQTPSEPVGPAFGFAETDAGRRFRKPLRFLCVKPTGIATGTTPPPGAPPGATAMHVRPIMAVCETLGEYADFVEKVLRRELIPMPPLAFQIVPLLLDAAGAMDDAPALGDGWEK